MKQKISLLILFIGLNVYAQTTFVKGYVITKNQEKKEVYFKAFGELIPEKIAYKTDENSTKLYTLFSDEINELFIESKVKFIRKNVKFEKLQKGMKSTSINNSKNFKLIEQNLLLRVLLEFDDKKLLTYLDENNNNYFFIEDDNTINLLEYKIFRKNNKNVIVKNFRNYLFKKYKPTVKLRLKYNESTIKNYLIFYSRDNNLTFTEYNGVFREFKDAVNITPKVGFSLLNQKNENTKTDIYNSEFSTNNLNLGLDLEYFFNTFHKKNSLILSLNYFMNSSGAGDFEYLAASNTPNSKIDYELSTIDFILKYRHYFQLKESRYIFTNIGIGTQFSSGFTNYSYVPINMREEIASLDYEANNLLFSLGAGFNYKKINIEVNYYLTNKAKYADTPQPNNIPKDGWVYNRSLISFSLGYTLF